MVVFLGAGILLTLAVGGSGVEVSDRWAPVTVSPGDLCLLMRGFFTTVVIVSSLAERDNTDSFRATGRRVGFKYKLCVKSCSNEVAS